MPPPTLLARREDDKVHLTLLHVPPVPPLVNFPQSSRDESVDSKDKNSDDKNSEDKVSDEDSKDKGEEDKDEEDNGPEDTMADRPGLPSPEFDELFGWGYGDQLIYRPNVPMIPVPINPNTDFRPTRASSSAQYQAAYFLGFCGLPAVLQTDLLAQLKEGEQAYCEDHDARRAAAAYQALATLALGLFYVTTGILFAAQLHPFRTSQPRALCRNGGPGALGRTLWFVALMLFWPVLLPWGWVWGLLAGLWARGHAAGRGGRGMRALRRFLEATATSWAGWQRRFVEAERRRRGVGGEEREPELGRREGDVDLGEFAKGGRGTGRTGGGRGLPLVPDERQNPFADPEDDQAEPQGPQVPQRTWTNL